MRTPNHQTPAAAASSSRPNTTLSMMLDTRGWRVSGSALASPAFTSRGESTCSIGSDGGCGAGTGATGCSNIFADLCGSRMIGLNSSVIIIENTTSALRYAGMARRYKKTSTHPEEATYPCCIPALGELGDVPPRGGKDQCTPCPDRTAPETHVGHAVGRHAGLAIRKNRTSKMLHPMLRRMDGYA